MKMFDNDHLGGGDINQPRTSATLDRHDHRRRSVHADDFGEDSAASAGDNHSSNLMIIQKEHDYEVIMGADSPPTRKRSNVNEPETPVPAPSSDSDLICAENAYIQDDIELCIIDGFQELLFDMDFANVDIFLGTEPGDRLGNVDGAKIDDINEERRTETTAECNSEPLPHHSREVNDDKKTTTDNNDPTPMVVVGTDDNQHHNQQQRLRQPTPPATTRPTKTLTMAADEVAVTVIKPNDTDDWLGPPGDVSVTKPFLNLNQSGPIIADIIQELKKQIRNRNRKIKHEDEKQSMPATTTSATSSPTKRKNSRRRPVGQERPTKMSLTTTIAVVKSDSDGATPTKMFQGPPPPEEDEEEVEEETSEDQSREQEEKEDECGNDTRFIIKSDLMKKLQNPDDGDHSKQLNNKFIQLHVRRLTKKPRTAKQTFQDNFKRYKRYFMLYRFCMFSQLDRPLYLTSSLSYMKYFHKEYETAVFHQRQQQVPEPGGDDDCSTRDSATTETMDSVESSSSSVVVVDNIVSTALVLDPLALDHIPDYNYAVIDYYVLRRQGPNTILESDVAHDSKIYVGTSWIRFGEKPSIINKRIVIPIKLLFELDQIDANEFIYSSEDYKYFITAVVTYYRRHDQLEARFQDGTACDKSKRKTRYSNNNAEDVGDGEESCLEYVFGFELENVQDIHFTEQLSDTGSLLPSDTNGFQQKRIKPASVKGEETHLLMRFDELACRLKCQCISQNRVPGTSSPPSSNKSGRNIVTELNRWHHLDPEDVFFREMPSSRNQIVQFPKHWRCNGTGNTKNSGGGDEQPKYITFRLVRTNMTQPDDHGDHCSKPFNVGTFNTRIKLNHARHHRKPCAVKATGGTTRTTRGMLGRKSASSPTPNGSRDQQPHYDRIATLNPRLIHNNDGFKVLYKFILIQQNTVMEDFTCPICSRPFQMLATLAIHLNVDHDRFKFSISLDTKNLKVIVTVTLNDQFEATFDNYPLERVLNFDKQHDRPMKRVGVSYLLAYAYDERTLANMFTYNTDTQQFQVEAPRTVSFEEMTQRRVFYHSRTLMPILPAEMDEDSETDDPEWRIKQKRYMMQDFIDVNAGEKRIMAMWNEHMMRNRTRYYADCHISRAVKDFLYIYTPTIIKLNLCYNCILHLVTLYLCETIESDDLLKSFIYLTRLRDLHQHCLKMECKLPSSQLPAHILKFLRYFEMAPGAIENLVLEERTASADGNDRPTLLPETAMERFVAMAGPGAHLFQQPDQMVLDSAMMAVLAMLHPKRPQQSSMVDVDGRQMAGHLQQLNRMKQMQLARLAQTITGTNNTATTN